jgi:hypothetical protein
VSKFVTVLASAGVALVLAAFALIAGTTDAALPKPKPWQWKPAKVVVRLTAARPIIGSEIGEDILSARCTGQGRGVAGRYTRFTCETRWGSSNGSYTSTLTIRILPIGTGKLCVVTTPEGKAVPHPLGKQGTNIKPERACP